MCALSKFATNLIWQKLSSGYLLVKYRDVHFNNIPERDGQTDIQTGRS